MALTRVTSLYNIPPEGRDSIAGVLIPHFFGAGWLLKGKGIEWGGLYVSVPLGQILSSGLLRDSEHMALMPLLDFLDESKIIPSDELVVVDAGERVVESSDVLAIEIRTYRLQGIGVCSFGCFDREEISHSKMLWAQWTQ